LLIDMDTHRGIDTDRDMETFMKIDTDMDTNNEMAGNMDKEEKGTRT
jgi:hypothetical protein